MNTSTEVRFIFTFGGSYNLPGGLERMLSISGSSDPEPTTETSIDIGFRCSMRSRRSRP